MANGQNTAALLSALSDGVTALLGSSGLPATQKVSLTDAINGAKGTLLNDVEGVVNTVINDASVALPTVEKDLGAAAESMADAAVTQYAGPLSVAVLPIANRLLDAAGGSIESAIAHLLTQAKAKWGQVYHVALSPVVSAPAPEAAAPTVSAPAPVTATTVIGPQS